MKRRTPKEVQRLRENADRKSRDPVVGFFAVRDMQAVCDGDGCVIAGSAKQLKEIIERHGANPRRYQIRSTTFSEIHRGIQRGGAYCFNEEAYRRFLPPAQNAGMSIGEEDFSEPGPKGVHLVRVGQHRSRPGDSER